MKELLNRYLTHQESRPEFMTHEALIGYVQNKEQEEAEEIKDLEQSLEFKEDSISRLEDEVAYLNSEISRLNYLLEKDDIE